jgi:hypothetical protein
MRAKMQKCELKLQITSLNGKIQAEMAKRELKWQNAS